MEISNHWAILAWHSQRWSIHKDKNIHMHDYIYIIVRYTQTRKTSENCKRNMLTSQLENSEPPEIKIGANEHPIVKNVPFLFCFPPSSKQGRVVIKEIGGVCHLSFQRKKFSSVLQGDSVHFFSTSHCHHPSRVKYNVAGFRTWLMIGSQTNLAHQNVSSSRNEIHFNTLMKTLQISESEKQTYIISQITKVYRSINI